MNVVSGIVCFRRSAWGLRSFPWLVLLLVLGELCAQTSAVRLPSHPPDDGLFLAGAGNRYFELHQQKAVSDALVHFSEKTGTRICMVLMNSPSKEVFENLQQQTRIQWCERWPCMVIFYDFDTKMLAVQTSPTYRDKQGHLLSNVFDAKAEDAWIRWIDQWMQANGQNSGLEVSLLGEFIEGFLGHLDTLWGDQSRSSSGAFSLWTIVTIFTLFIGFFGSFVLLQQRILARKKWYFPVGETTLRFKARHGGGLVSARDFR